MNSRTLIPLGSVATIIGVFLIFVEPVRALGLILLCGGIATFVAGRIVKEGEKKSGDE